MRLDCEKNENKQKESGISPFLKNTNSATTAQLPLRAKNQD